MSDESAGQVWLYEDGGWTLADDPVPWSQDGDDVRAKYAEAGYTDMRGLSDSFLLLGLDSEDNTSSGAQLAMFVRDEHPQCLIEIEGASGTARTVYAARLPDGLDLMARWAPIATTGMLSVLARGLLHREPDGRDYATADWLVEKIAHRAYGAAASGAGAGHQTAVVAALRPCAISMAASSAGRLVGTQELRLP
jgi:hypothetical protein